MAIGVGILGLSLTLVAPDSHAAGKDTLVVASGADAVTLDPGVSFDGQSPLIWRTAWISKKPP